MVGKFNNYGFRIYITMIKILYIGIAIVVVFGTLAIIFKIPLVG